MEKLKKNGAEPEEKMNDKIWIFGEPENLEELEKKLSKLILSVEMENWEKAEMFASNIKELVQGQSEELDRSIFRIILTVRKPNYEKSVELYDNIKEKLLQVTGEQF